MIGLPICMIIAAVALLRNNYNYHYIRIGSVQLIEAPGQLGMKLPHYRISGKGIMETNPEYWLILLFIR